MSRLSNPEIHKLNNEINALKATMQAEQRKVSSMKVYDVTAIQSDIDILQAKIDAHNEFMKEQTEVEARRVKASKKVLDKTLDDLKKMADKLDAAWPNIVPAHRGRIGDLKSKLRQAVR